MLEENQKGRGQAGRQADENEMTGTLQKTEEKAKKKKKADSQKDPKKKERKKEVRARQKQLRFGETPAKNQPFTVSCLEVSVTDENLCEAPVSPHVILMRGNSPEEAPRTLSEEGGGEPQLKDTCLLSNCTSVLKFVCFSLQLQHFIF